jgi:hypothetical protein
MKPGVINLLAVCGALILCVGCSTIKPATSQPPIAAAAPTTPKPDPSLQYQPHDNPMSKFVRGWLEGDTAGTPLQAGDTVSLAWLYLGLPFYLGESLAAMTSH